MRRLAATIATAAIGVTLATFGLNGCSSDILQGVLFPNQRPTVSITEAPRSATGPSTYACEISWAGFDADGRVAGFRYALDPAAANGAETLWVSTPENRGVFSFRSDSVVAGVGHELHTFVVEAIDDRGLASLPACVAFDATTLAPRVTITNPIPSAVLAPEVPTALRVSWTGDDPDGLGSKRPTGYRYRLFSAGSVPSMNAVRLNPDTLRTLYAPAFAGWDSLPGGATGIDLRDLTPASRSCS